MNFHRPNGHQSTLHLPHIHPFTHSFIHRRCCQPCKVPSSSSGAGGVRCHTHTHTAGIRCLAHGHLDTWSGGTGDFPTFWFVENLHEPLSQLLELQPNTLMTSSHPVTCVVLLYYIVHPTKFVSSPGQ